MIHAIFVITLLLPIHSWYDYACCGDQHCYPVACDQLVEETDGGWTYLPLKLHFYAAQVLPSKDGHCHICTAPQPSGQRALCAYIQTGS